MDIEDVRLPTLSMENGEFTMKNWKDLEKLNKQPIVVYNMEKRKGKKVHLTCIVAPSKKVLEKYKDVPTCHLIMLNSSHIAYIPDINSYMRNICNNRKKKKM